MRATLNRCNLRMLGGQGDDSTRGIYWSDASRSELWGNLFHNILINCMNSTQSLTLIPYEFSYLYRQSPITVSGKVKGVVYCIMSLVSSKRKKKSGPSYQRSCP